MEYKLPVEIEVHVIHRVKYTFPQAGNEDPMKCSAHADMTCVHCARNPSTCSPDNTDEQAGCGVYALSGMHWDTCPNRIKGDL